MDNTRLPAIASSIGGLSKGFSISNFEAGLFCEFLFLKQKLPKEQILVKTISSEFPSVKTVNS